MGGTGTPRVRKRVKYDQTLKVIFSETTLTTAEMIRYLDTSGHVLWMVLKSKGSVDKRMITRFGSKCTYHRCIKWGEDLLEAVQGARTGKNGQTSNTFSQKLHVHSYDI